MADINKLKNRARREEQRQNWPAAIDLYTRALRESENRTDSAADFSLYNRIGDIHLRLGEVERAVALYEQAIERYAEHDLHTSAIALCNKVLRVQPARIQTYLRLGRLQLETGLQAEARVNYLRYATEMLTRGEPAPAYHALAEYVERTTDVNSALRFAGALVSNDRANEALALLLHLKESVESRGGDGSPFQRPIDAIRGFDLRPPGAGHVPAGVEDLDAEMARALGEGPPQAPVPPPPDDRDDAESPLGIEFLEAELEEAVGVDDTAQRLAAPIHGEEEEDSTSVEVEAPPPTEAASGPRSAPVPQEREAALEPQEGDAALEPPEGDAALEPPERDAAFEPPAWDVDSEQPDAPFPSTMPAVEPESEDAEPTQWELGPAAEPVLDLGADPNEAGVGPPPVAAAPEAGWQEEFREEPVPVDGRANGSSASAPEPPPADEAEEPAFSGAALIREDRCAEKHESDEDVASSPASPLAVPPSEPMERESESEGASAEEELPLPMAMWEGAETGTGPAVLDPSIEALPPEPSEPRWFPEPEPVPSEPPVAWPGSEPHELTWEPPDGPDAGSRFAPLREPPTTPDEEPAEPEAGDPEAGDPEAEGIGFGVESAEEWEAGSRDVTGQLEARDREESEAGDVATRASARRALERGREWKRAGDLAAAIPELERALESPELFLAAYDELEECRRLLEAAEAKRDVGERAEPAPEARGPFEEAAGASVGIVEAPEEAAPFTGVSDAPPVAPLTLETEPSADPFPASGPGDEVELSDSEADGTFEEWVRASPQALLARALEELEARQEWEKARKVVERLMEIEPSDPDLLRRRIECLRALGEEENLERAYVSLGEEYEAAGRWGDARAAYFRALEYDPDDETARNAIARIEEQAARDLAAGPTPADVDAGAPAEPVDGEVVPPSLATEFPHAARAGAQSGESPGGTPPAAAGVETDVTPYDWLQGGREGTVDFDVILAELKEQLAEGAADEPDGGSRTEVGERLKDMGLLDDAIRELQAAVRSPDAPPRAFELLGDAFIEKGQPRVAARLLEEALGRLGSSVPEEGLLGVIYQLGFAYEQVGERGRALECYERIFSVDIDYRDVRDRIQACAA